MDDILFKPLNLGGNAITLKHRVVLAPLTRNRGSEPASVQRSYMKIIIHKELLMVV